MKVTKVDIFLLDAGAQRASRKPVCCRIYTDEGIYGDGEAGVAYGVGANGAFGCLEDLAHMVVGQNPFQVEKIWEMMFRDTFWGLNGGAIFYAAMSAIDIALMDIKGKALNVPVYELIGGRQNDKLRCYASQLQFGWTSMIGPYGKTEDYVKIVKHAMSEGYDAVKIDFVSYDREGKPTTLKQTERFISQDLYDMVDERMAAIRRECGKVDLIVENHDKTNTISAIRIGELCDKYHCYAYEETTGPLNYKLHRNIYNKVKTPLAEGERVFTRWGYVPFFEDGTVQLVQADACNCGGITETKKVCDMAHVYDCGVQIHVAGGPISTAASLQIETAIPNFSIHEHHFRSTQPAIAALGKYDYQPVNGYYECPDLPGLGQELSDFAIETALKHITVE